MGGPMAILALFTRELTIEERKLVTPKLMSEYKHIEETLFITSALFLVTVLPQFWSWKILDTPVRFHLWFAPVVMSWVRRVYTKLPA
jgi:hypothetical protein